MPFCRQQQADLGTYSCLGFYFCQLLCFSCCRGSGCVPFWFGGFIHFVSDCSSFYLIFFPYYFNCFFFLSDFS